MGSAVAGASIHCALAASVLDHRDAFSSVMKFFRDLLTLGRNDDLVREREREREGGGKNKGEGSNIFFLQIEADRMQRQVLVNSFITEHGPTIMDRRFCNK